MFNDMVRWPYLAALAASISGVMLGEKESKSATVINPDEIHLSAYVSAQSKDECPARAANVVTRQTSQGLWGRFNSIFIACAHGKPEDEKRQTTYLKCDAGQLSGDAECTPVEPR
jgi:hypothetical protein